jgi:broad specificity phosphatase PhoE
MTSTDTLEPASMPEAPAAPRATAVRRGSIVLARHGEPALSRKCRLTSRQYREWWGRYELGGLLAGQSPPAHVLKAAKDAGIILTSTRLRSIETAKAAAPDRDFRRDALFIEAPLPPPPFPDIVKLPPRTWGVVSRLWWWFGHHEGQETRREAQARAGKAAGVLGDLAEGGQDVLLVAHGYFNILIGLELRRRGWRCVQDRGFKYWSTRRYERA